MRWRAFYFATGCRGYGVTPETPSGYGHVGVALATSTVALVNFFALGLFMRRRIKRLNGRDVLQFVRTDSRCVGDHVRGLLFQLRLLDGFFPTKTLLVKLIEAFVPIAIGGVTFLFAAKLFRILELEKLFDIFRRRLGGKKLS